LHALVPSIAPEATMASLGIGQLQLVELVKVRMRRTRCVVLDEPSELG